MGLLVPISWVYWRGVARGWSHEIMFIKDSAQCLERSRPSINNTYYLFALIYIFSTAFRPPFFLFPYTIPSFLLPCLSVHLCVCVCVCVCMYLYVCIFFAEISVCSIFKFRNITSRETEIDIAYLTDKPQSSCFFFTRKSACLIQKSGT